MTEKKKPSLFREAGNHLANAAIVGAILVLLWSAFELVRVMVF